MAQISIVIPTYNAEKFLIPTLRGVTAQTFTDWELIVLDDGSQDATVCLAHDYAAQERRLRVYRRENGGIAAARNEGFSKTSPNTPYVTFLDHDDVWQPEALELLLKTLEADPQAAAAYGLARYIDAQGQPIREGELEAAQRRRIALVEDRRVPWPIDRPTTFEVAAYWSYITTPGQALIRRAALPSAAPFDPTIAPADDWDLWLRLTLQGHITLINRVILDYRLHERNTSRNESLMQEALLKARQKFYRLPNLTPDQRRTVLLCYRDLERQRSESHLRTARQFLARRDVIGAAKHLRQAVRYYLVSRRAALN
jgi:glycosyltransferase involved in cell wall biosynthesis